jgi:hypothetical protein
VPWFVPSPALGFLFLSLLPDFRASPDSTFSKLLEAHFPLTWSLILWTNFEKMTTVHRFLLQKDRQNEERGDRREGKKKREKLCDNNS